MSTGADLLDDFADEKLPVVRRRTLLPIWIKIFIWLFMIFGVVGALLSVYGLTGAHYDLELYGLETTIPLSFVGILLTIIFLFKGVVAFSLWFEQGLAIKLAIIDAAAGILLCTAIMINFPFHFRDGPSFVFRPELIILAPYLWKMAKIEKRWESASAKSMVAQQDRYFK